MFENELKNFSFTFTMFSRFACKKLTEENFKCEVLVFSKHFCNDLKKNYIPVSFSHVIYLLLIHQIFHKFAFIFSFVIIDLTIVVWCFHVFQLELAPFDRFSITNLKYLPLLISLAIHQELYKIVILQSSLSIQTQTFGLLSLTISCAWPSVLVLLFQPIHFCCYLVLNYFHLYNSNFQERHGRNNQENWKKYSVPY